MLTLNYGCVGATLIHLYGYRIYLTCNVFLYVDNSTTISFINSFMTKTLYQAIRIFSHPRRPLGLFNSK